MNLLTNANKFTQNGVISVHCAHDIVSMEEHYIKVFVKDEGIGISQVDQ
jgi:signal transduction histidine kinase